MSQTSFAWHEGMRDNPFASQGPRPREMNKNVLTRSARQDLTILRHRSWTFPKTVNLAFPQSHLDIMAHSSMAYLQDP